MTKIKKIILFMLALVLVIPTTVLFAACGDDSSKYSYVTITGETEGFTVNNYGDYESIFNLPSYTASESEGAREAIEAGKTFDISFILLQGYYLPEDFEIVCNGVSYGKNDFQSQDSLSYELKGIVAPNNDFTISVVHGPKKKTSTVTFSWYNASTVEENILSSTHFKSNVSFGDVVAETEYTFAELKEIFSSSEIFEYGDKILFEIWNDNSYVLTDFIKESNYSTLNYYDKETKHSIVMFDVSDYDIEIELFEGQVSQTSNISLYECLLDSFTVIMEDCDITGYNKEFLLPYGHEMYNNYYDPSTTSLKTNSNGGFYGQFILVGYTFSEDFKAVYDNMSLKIGNKILTRGEQASSSTFTIDIIDVSESEKEDLQGVLTINIPSFFDMMNAYGEEEKYVSQAEIQYITITPVIVKENGTELSLSYSFVENNVLATIKKSKWVKDDVVYFAIVNPETYESTNNAASSSMVIYEEQMGSDEIFYVPVNYDKLILINTYKKTISSITIDGKTIVLGETVDGYSLNTVNNDYSYKLAIPKGNINLNNVTINYAG